MTDTLHTRLLAAVQQRMDVARAACDGDSGQWFMGDRWNVYRTEDEARYDEDYHGEENRLVVYGNIKDQSEHIAANDPATVLRHCVRDLAVLERHKVCDCEQIHSAHCTCQMMVALAEWPCDEIRAMATAYGIEVDADGG